jgi:uncharacterized membrane protein (DUF485 family)
MTEPQGRAAARANEPADGWAASSEHRSEIDWVAAERSPEFRELVKKKNAFVIPATIFFLGWYLGFVLLCGYAPDFMGEEFITDGLTVGYVLAFSQFIMVWGLAAWYLRKSDRVFDPLAKRAADRALQSAGGAAGPAAGGRFGRGPGDGAAADEEVTPR